LVENGFPEHAFNIESRGKVFNDGEAQKFVQNDQKRIFPEKSTGRICVIAAGTLP